MPPRKPKQLQTIVRTDPFESAVAVAIARISAVDSTRAAYALDFRKWSTFCSTYNVDRTKPSDEAVVAFVEYLKKSDASTTRGRRMSALSAIYRELRRKNVTPSNPFSADDGPRRERSHTSRPTPIVTAEAVAKVLATCDGSLLGIRDAAIIRVFWGTGMRRVSLLSMTFERLRHDADGYLATVLKKGGENQDTLIRGRARVALDRWLEMLRVSSMTTGAIWREDDGLAMTTRELNRMLDRRSKEVGVALSPHMFRVAFLTYNPEGIEAKQDAAGHADPSTTRIYDRASWRGRTAFMAMPEVEDLALSRCRPSQIPPRVHFYPFRGNRRIGRVTVMPSDPAPDPKCFRCGNAATSFLDFWPTPTKGGRFLTCQPCSDAVFEMSTADRHRHFDYLGVTWQK